MQYTVEKDTRHLIQVTVVQVMRLEIPRRQCIDQSFPVLFANGGRETACQSRQSKPFRSGQEKPLNSRIIVLHSYVDRYLRLIVHCTEQFRQLRVGTSILVVPLVPRMPMCIPMTVCLCCR